MCIMLNLKSEGYILIVICNYPSNHYLYQSLFRSMLYFNIIVLMLILLFCLYFNEETNSDQTISLHYILLYTYNSIEFQSNVSV